MTTSMALQPRMSMAEYLAWEEQQPGRNEFHRGEVYAMVGGQRGHFRIGINLARHLGNQLAGTPCQVFGDGMKVQIGDNTVLYPDLLVTCNPRFRADDLVITDPILIVEVLSPSTQAYDRSQKFAFYRRLPSLREYALIDPATRRVEVFRPAEDGHWKLFDMSEDDALHLESVGCRVAMTDVFDGLDGEAVTAATQ